jgi:hypothetical protein
MSTEEEMNRRWGIEPRLFAIACEAVDRRGNRFVWMGGPKNAFMAMWEPAGGWPRLVGDTWDA